VFPGLLSRHQGDLLEGMSRRRLFGRERRLQVTDDPVDHRRLGQEGHDLHPPALWKP
jgi:hypothetical protein